MKCNGVLREGRCCLGSRFVLAYLVSTLSTARPQRPAVALLRRRCAVATSPSWHPVCGLTTGSRPRKTRLHVRTGPQEAAPLGWGGGAPNCRPFLAGPLFYPSEGAARVAELRCQTVWGRARFEAPFPWAGWIRHPPPPRPSTVLAPARTVRGAPSRTGSPEGRVPGTEDGAEHPA